MTNNSASGKIKQLDNDYTRKMASAQVSATQHAQLLKVRRRRFMRIIVGFGALILLFGFQLISSKANLRTVNQQISQSKVQLNQVKAKNDRLNTQVKQLHNDDYLQQLIRSKYDYSKSGETIYSLPNDATSNIQATK